MKDLELWKQIVNFFPAFQGEIGEENKKALYDFIIKNYSKNIEFDLDKLTSLITSLNIVNNGFYADNPSRLIAEAIGRAGAAVLKASDK